MNNLGIRCLVLSSLLLCAPCVTAQPVEGYVTTTSGRIVKGAFGACLRIAVWNEERVVEGCDGFVAQTKAVAAPAMVAVPAIQPASIAAPPPPVSLTPRLARSVDLRSDALFAVNSAELKEEGQAAIEGLLERIRAVKGLKSVTIVGHTDSTGWVEHNNKLSERRAQSVKAVLVKSGVDPALITTSGEGARKPIAYNMTPEGRAKNRRVTITIVASE